MKHHIILVTGGQRSGKSLFAEGLALQHSNAPIYVATAEIHDEEMRRRVAKHRERRGPNWTTVDDPLDISRHDFSGRTVLIDCVTLWASNHLFAAGEDAEKALSRLTQQVDEIANYDNSTIIFVTNEIGLGGTSPNPLQRKFTDLQGSINQYIASKAHTVYLVVSGIPVMIKDCK